MRSVAYLRCVAVAGLVCLGCVVAQEPEDCKIKLPDGVVDLTSLGNADGTPKFKDVKCDQDGDLYSYNTCGAFVEGSCMDAAVCKSGPDHSGYTVLGRAGQTRYSYDAETKTLILGYFSGGMPPKLTEVTTKCDESACTPQLTPEGTDSRGQIYKMTVTSICACPGLCSASGPINECKGSSSSAGGAISGGSVFLIVVVAVIAIYLVGGVAYMKVVKKANGTDIIPNKDMWKSVPVLVKNGVMFLVSKCSSKKSGYINS